MVKVLIGKGKGGSNPPSDFPEKGQNILTEAYPKLLHQPAHRTSRKFSKSKINEFKTCPRKYYFGHRTDLGKSIRDDINYKAHVGSVVHKMIELYNDPFADEDTINIHVDSMDENDESVEFCRKNLKSFFKILKKYGLGQAEYCEFRVEDPERDISGNIDAIYDVAGDKWIIDYKTGKFYKNKMNDYIFELYVYVILCRRVHGFLASKIGMFFTDHPKSSFVIDVTEEDYKKFDKMMLDYMEKMEGNHFPRIRSKLCGYCKFVNLCDAYRDEILKD